MLSQISWSSPINEDKYNFQLPFNFTGNTECCMLLLGNLENPLPTDLSKELLKLCSPAMSVVSDLLRGQGNFYLKYELNLIIYNKISLAFQPFEYEEE